MKVLKIVTRKSPLALLQTKLVCQELYKLYPTIEVEIVPIITLAERDADTPLYNMGGREVFIKELQKCVADGTADLAVHSMKDVPYEPDGQTKISPILVREDPRDALISASGDRLEQLPHGALVATSSLRRQIQLKRFRPDLNFIPLRGNISTRLRKLKTEAIDAIVLAVAGLKRLDLAEHITQIFTPQELLPAAGQGALAVQWLAAHEAVEKILKPLLSEELSHEVLAERAFCKTIGGDCTQPMASFARITGEALSLSALVGNIQTNKILINHAEGKVEDVKEIGVSLALKMIEQGAQEFLS